jgi:tRNA dimethylallyltransferase
MLPLQKTYGAPFQDATDRKLPAPCDHPFRADDQVFPNPVVGTLTQDYPLMIIVGPTAAGKSALAIALAKQWHGEIVNCDSVQIYRGFDIGTGKVTPAERGGIPHHLLDIAEPSQTFTAGDYRREAIRALDDIRSRARLPILVGGTGLYLRALLLGLFEGPERSEDLRERLGKIAKRHGREFLHRMLIRMDSTAAGRIHPRDTPKIIRALEVSLLARRPITAMHAEGRSALEGYRVLKAGLNPARTELSRRIAERTETMFETGLLDEVRDMLKREDVERIKPLGAIGYREAREVLGGKLTVPEAILKTQAATRQYAKRQMTWFKREKDVEWFAGFGDDSAIERQVVQWLAGELQDSKRKLLRKF